MDEEIITRMTLKYKLQSYYCVFKGDNIIMSNKYVISRYDV